MPELDEAEIRKKIGDGSILGITVDTAVFDTYGCNLQYPVLAKLDQFKVVGVELLLSEIVVNEISSHIADAAREAQRALKTALREHEKLWQLGRHRDQDWNAFQIDVDAVAMADEQMEHYLKAVGAEVVPVAGNGDLSGEVFRRYFELVTPFENRESKKHEFPDAFALLSLEQAATKADTLFLCVSPDKGWASFAKESAHLVVVTKLDVALSWFNDPEKLIAEKVISLWKAGAIAGVIAEAFTYYLDGIPFDAECTAPLYYEPEPVGAILLEIFLNQIGEPIVIASDADEVVLTVKLVAGVEFEAQFDFYVHDHVDNDDVFMTGETLTKVKDVDFEVTLTVAREMEGNDIEISDVTVNSGNISVDFGYVEPFREDGPEPEE